jgi:hypothetical protein
LQRKAIFMYQAALVFNGYTMSINHTREWPKQLIRSNTAYVKSCNCPNGYALYQRGNISTLLSKLRTASYDVNYKWNKYQIFEKILLVPHQMTRMKMSLLVEVEKFDPGIPGHFISLLSQFSLEDINLLIFLMKNGRADELEWHDGQLTCIFTGQLTKLLVTTGSDVGSKKIEIIDLVNTASVCHPRVLDDYPFDQVAAASGGLLKNNIVLICGGSSPLVGINSSCFAITDTTIEPSVQLIYPRYGAASVVLNINTLWITGGLINVTVRTRSTEFVNPTGTRPGPDLPHTVAWHCLVSLNETTVLLIGGEVPSGTVSKNTWYYNNDHHTWTTGPSLINGRAHHSCAMFKRLWLNSPQHRYMNTDTVIVAGGYNRGTLITTEFLNLDSNSWTPGTN